MTTEPHIGQSAQSLKKEIRRTVSAKYLLYLPQAYADDEKKWPLILFLHGAGERGDDLELVKQHGPPKIVVARDDFPFVVVSPQCPVDRWWDTEVLSALLDDVVAQHRIDEDRIYLTGLSMGGFGTWSLAVRQPDRFAAIAPICGGGVTHATRYITHLPVWVFHGGKDQTVLLRESQDMVDALKRYGANVRFTVYPEAGHDSWTETYDNPELYEWFLKHRRSGTAEKASSQ